jgi:hypothetical protein
MFRKVAMLTAVVAVWAIPALAQSPLPPLPFPPLPMQQGTPEERAACSPDVRKILRFRPAGYDARTGMPAGQSPEDQRGLQPGVGQPRS